MHLYFLNVNDALMELATGFQTGIFLSNLPDYYSSSDRAGLRRIDYEPPLARTKSRYGDVIVIQEPVCLTYKNPLERVLFNKHRNCNPFFHMIEALWTLAGQDNIEPLLYFNSKVADFSDDGKTWYGAYGKRWMDNCQLEEAVAILKKDRTCRRVILQQWMPYDLSRVLEEPTCKDVPCNTEVMFLPRRVVDGTITTEYLDMTVINRSNDLIWGALGSNYVTFSMLLEYVSIAAGYFPGFYHQVSNNLHVYAGPAEFAGLKDYPPDFEVWSQKFNPQHFMEPMPPAVRDYQYILSPQRSHGETKEDFDKDLRALFLHPMGTIGIFRTNFFCNTIAPMIQAWNLHKQRSYMAACAVALGIEAQDWKLACIEWLMRTADNYKMKGKQNVPTT